MPSPSAQPESRSSSTHPEAAVRDLAEDGAGAGLSCVLCGRALPQGVIECPACTTEAVEPPAETDEVRRLIRKAGAFILVGSIILPLVSTLVGLHFSFKARDLYQSLDTRDPTLRGSIERLWLAAAFFITLYGLAWLGWIGGILS